MSEPNFNVTILSCGITLHLYTFEEFKNFKYAIFYTSFLNSKITVNASAESGKKTITTSAWGAVIHRIILPEAGTYLVGADYSGTNVCFVSSGGGNKYLMPGGTALVTVDARTVIDFKSNTSNQATWTEFLPFYIRLM